jgi:hypothetical protein
MSMKSKVFAAAATMTLVGGVGALGATSASAATPSCGAGTAQSVGGQPACISIFSRDFGTHLQPNFVLDVLRQGEKVGQPIILFRESNSDPAEDFVVSNQGLVSDFFTAQLVSAAVALHYGGLGHYTVAPGTRTCFDAAAPVNNVCAYPDFTAVEYQYAPFGVDSGLCVGVGTTAVAGTKVALEPCGASSKTIWIIDNSNPAGINGSYVPLINGSDTNFSQPYVLTYPSSAYPTDRPRPQLFTANLTGFSNAGLLNPTGVSSAQLWGADFGPLP